MDCAPEMRLPGSLAGLRLRMVMHVGNCGGSRAWQGVLGRRRDWGVGPPRSTGVRKGSSAAKTQPPRGNQSNTQSRSRLVLLAWCDRSAHLAEELLAAQQAEHVATASAAGGIQPRGLRHCGLPRLVRPAKQERGPQARLVRRCNQNVKGDVAAS